MTRSVPSHMNFNGRPYVSNISPVSSSIHDAKHPLRGSWVNPNASCPVCGCAVYFYQSPYGGSVYFDELGPPWPKHACTDHAYLNSVVERASVKPGSRWDETGWQPLVNFSVSLVGSGLYKISGRADPYERTVLFRTTGSTEVEIVRFREGRGVAVELSLLVRDSAAKEWLICEGVGTLAGNHPPDEGLVVVQRIPYFEESFEQKSLRGEWTPPNAKCAACGGGVYRYALPDGAHAVFEELGSPWPEHLCVDHASAEPPLKRHGVGNTRWPLNGWQSLEDATVSLVAPPNLYKVQGQNHAGERTFLFRIDPPCAVEIIRFRLGGDANKVELSILARDHAAQQWLVFEGVGKVAPDFPPANTLNIVRRLPDAGMVKCASHQVTTDFAPSPTQASADEPAAVELERIHEQTIAPLFPSNRLEQIDEKIRALLSEIAQLNDEKTRIIHTFLMPAADEQR